MKLAKLVFELNKTLEHWGDIETEIDGFDVKVIQDPDQDDIYLITFSPASSLKDATIELCEEVYERNDSGFYHPSHVYLDSVAQKINKVLGNA